MRSKSSWKHMFWTKSDDRYSHSHQLNLKLDWSRIKLWLAQIVLAFLEEEKKCYLSLHLHNNSFSLMREQRKRKQWSGSHPAAQWALHEEVFVSGVQLRCPCRLEVWLQKPLAECGHWEHTTKLKCHSMRVTKIFLWVLSKFTLW